MTENDTAATDSSAGYGNLVRKLGRKTRKILDLFQNEDYINSVAKDVRMSYNGCQYHVEKLEELGLVAATEEEEGRQFYKITDKGEAVLSKVNVPE